MNEDLHKGEIALVACDLGSARQMMAVLSQGSGVSPCLWQAAPEHHNVINKTRLATQVVPDRARLLHSVRIQEAQSSW